MEKEISVIIPAYNSQHYITSCIESLVAQTKKPSEIIVINDGSTDETLSVLNRLRERFGELLIILDQENQGQSASRNRGIVESVGKYIFFIDADDYVEPDMLEKMYNKAVLGDYDVVSCDVACIYPNKTITISSGIDGDYATLSLFERKQLLSMYPIVCNKIYHRRLFDEKKIRFEKGIWFEDVLFINMLVPQVNRIASIQEPLYCYVQRQGSVTYTYSSKLLDIHKMLEKTLSFYSEQGIFQTYLDELEYMYTRYLFATYIKRLAKAKDKAIFRQGISFAQRTVQDRFPKYRQNPYLKKICAKNLYLKLFSAPIAWVVYFVEKSRMN